ncbi:hypothetical protein FACS1894154_07190 [Betaproteobacteria bacterium]|nr:hypothetical protein AGMMS49543_18340 [Betaproteobacteria bacterium]GHT99670.1 hypothetical protein FACS1894154_07190 [Betaproteobacteria bacterium]GHU00379.1 hypothetical protein AGMMS49960_08260 [Betaproteobacteria bacterium]GHU06455.1 hypothetical protein AGMMS50225_01400 [Betaproteobacteria bacterium]GHU21724.1 hypothetical protein AGMMS50243_19960 [Betaproteobacteria bacterium]
MRKTACILLAATLPLLSGCDALSELLDLPNPTREAAEAEAIGGACRHTGRSLEDCYLLHPESPKASIFAGWKSMNDYMTEHNIQDVPSLLPQEIPPTATAATETKSAPEAPKTTTVSTSHPPPAKP